MSGENQPPKISTAKYPKPYQPLVDADMYVQGLKLNREDIAEILDYYHIVARDEHGNKDSEGTKILVNNLWQFHNNPPQEIPFFSRAMSSLKANHHHHAYRGMAGGGLMGRTAQEVDHIRLLHLEKRAMTEMADTYIAYNFARARIAEVKLEALLTPDENMRDILLRRIDMNSEALQQEAPLAQDLLEEIDQSMKSVDLGVQVSVANFDNPKWMYPVLHPRFTYERFMFMKKLKMLRAKIGTVM